MYEDTYVLIFRIIRFMISGIFFLEIEIVAGGCSILYMLPVKDIYVGSILE